MKRKELKTHLRTPIHSNIAFTIRNVVTTAADCNANISISFGTDNSKKQKKLSILKQSPYIYPILVVEKETKPIYYCIKAILKS